jgi:hypothetical protein
MAEDEKFNRLPKWAQTEIRRLREDVVYYKKKASVGPEGSNTFLDPYSEVAKPLGENPTIGFGIWETGQFVVRYNGTSLSVTMSGGRRGLISVIPVSGNVVELRQRGDW